MNKYLEILCQLKSLMAKKDTFTDSEQNHFDLIESKIELKLPDDIKRFMAVVDKASPELMEIFWGYEPIPLSMIANEYQNFNNGYFFNGFGCDDNFDVEYECGPRISTNLEGEFKDGEEIEVRNVRHIVPLCNSSCYYLVLYFTSKNTAEIMTFTEDGFLFSAAPSLTEHLDELEIGLKSGKYVEVEEELNCPTDWYKRSGNTDKHPNTPQHGKTNPCDSSKPVPKSPDSFDINNWHLDLGHEKKFLNSRFPKQICIFEWQDYEVSKIDSNYYEITWIKSSSNDQGMYICFVKKDNFEPIAKQIKYLSKKFKKIELNFKLIKHDEPEDKKSHPAWQCWLEATDVEFKNKKINILRNIFS